MAHTLAAGSTETPARTPPRSDSLQRRYGVAVLAVLVAGLGTFMLRSAMVLPHAIAAFLAAILLTGWYAGLGPAALALVLCVALDSWLPTVLTPHAESALGLRHLWFVFFALAAGYFGTVRRRATRELQEARDHLEEEVVLRTAQLRRSESYLAAAQRLGRTGCWAAPIGAGGIVYWSAELYRILGYDAASTTPSVDLLTSRASAGDRERLTAAIREARDIELDYGFFRPDGTLRYLRAIGRPLQDSSGRAIEYLGVVMDVSELREGERKLVEAERLAHVAYWEVDQDANLVSLTDEGRRIFGLPPGETSLPWAKFLERVHVDDRALVERARTRIMTGETSFKFGYRVVRPDSEVRYVEKIVDVDRDPSGRPIRAIGALQDVTERRRAEEALREARDRLQRLSRRLLEVQEEERRHLARELHDEFGQLLATIGLHLHAARTLTGDALRGRLDESDALLHRAGDELRGLALELRPMLLETSGLDATVRWLAEQQQQATGTPIEVRGYLDDVPEETAIVMFRVVQEALTNVARHAGARHVWIELDRNDDLLELVIRDDGIGFNVSDTLERAAAAGHMGIVGMGERVELLGGTLIVESEPGSGTAIRASIPRPGTARDPAPPGTGVPE